MPLGSGTAYTRVTLRNHNFMQALCSPCPTDTAHQPLTNASIGNHLSTAWPVTRKCSGAAALMAVAWTSPISQLEVLARPEGFGAEWLQTPTSVCLAPAREAPRREAADDDEGEGQEYILKWQCGPVARAKLQGGLRMWVSGQSATVVKGPGLENKAEPERVRNPECTLFKVSGILKPRTEMC